MKKHKFLAALLVLTFMSSSLSPVFADSWTTYNNSNTGGAIGNNTIKSAGVESGGTKWFGTNGGGVAKFTGTSWQKYGTAQGLANNTVKAICFDSSGNRWFATGGGVSRYTGTSWQKWTTSQGLPTNNCLSIAAEGTIIWVGTYDRGVSKFNGTSWQTYNTTNSGLLGVRVDGVAVESGGTKWFGTNNGISKFDGTTWTNYTTVLPQDDIYAAAIAPDGNKWFASLGGVYRFTGTSWTFYSTSQGLPKNDTRSIKVASDGTVWAGSYGSGVSKFTGATPWVVYNTSNSGLVNNYGNAIATEGTAVVWFGTNLGVSKYDMAVTPPVAQFVGSPLSGNKPLTVNFTDQSTNNPTAWSWTFGDSGTSTAQNPSHQYTTAGTYTVSLTASNAGGSDIETKTNYITVTDVPPPPAPVAQFVGTPTSGETPLTVNFTDQSTNSPTSWSWTFGDSGTSTQQNPSHQYTTAGTYTVSLTASNAGGSDIETKTSYITVTNPVPHPNFDASPKNGIAPLVVQFVDQSTGPIDTWKWDFNGDGSIDWSKSSPEVPPYTFTAAGVYSSTLNVRDDNTSQWYSTTKVDFITVTSPIPPTAEFTANKTSGSVPLTIQFTDQSTGDNLNSWSWTFGDTGTSTAQNPSHVYNAEGTYTVSLTVSSPYGTDTETKTNYITVNPAQPCDANFVGNPTSGFAPLQVQFSDTSTGSVTKWNWTFGDSGTSTQANPTHSYGSGTFTVSLTVTGPLNSDSITKTDYITVQTAPSGGSGLSFVDSPDDLSNLHPYLWCKGYGTENGLWAKAQSTHSEVWARITAVAPTGATYHGTYDWYGYPVSRNLSLTQMSAMAYVVSKIQGYGEYAQDEVLTLNGCPFVSGGGDADLAAMETFWGYCMAYDAIVDDQLHGGPTWMNSSQKAAALATIADYLADLNFDPGDTWRVRPTHNFMVARAANHACGLYNLRGEAGYESLYNLSRPYDLIYHNERINGLCDQGVLGTTAPLSNDGPRPADGMVYEGPSYGAYQGSRALVHRHVMELNEYPNPDTVLDENKSGFALNWCLAWMAIATPGLDEWADVSYTGDHGVIHAMRYHAAIDKAVAISDKTVIPPAKIARVGEWFTRQVIPSPKGSSDNGWWQGFEMLWYDASIEPMTPADAGIPLYLHMDDSEFHMYRTSWDIYPNSNPDDVYIYLRNAGHDGHNYWAEKHAGAGVPYNCTAQTTSHDGSDNGHFSVFKENGNGVAYNNGPAGNTERHNCLTIDGVGNMMDDKRGYQVPALANADCIGAVDSDYGHGLESLMGGIYLPISSGNDGYIRYFFVIRNPMYAIVVDELESGHTIDFRCYCEANPTKISDSVYDGSQGHYEILYPSSGYTSSTTTDPILITTTATDLAFIVQPKPASSVTRSYPGGVAKAVIGSDTVIYNPGDGSYSESGISGDAKLFAQRTGGALIFKATTATGSQYGLSCAARASMSVSGRKATIYVYGTAAQTVTVTSPYGTDVFANVPAGQTVSKVLTGLSIAPPVADFIAVPREGWNTYVAPEFVSFSTGWITDYLWEFGDGEWSTELAPHHKYAQAGLYTVKLTVAGPGGSDSMTKSQYIYIKDFANYNWPDYIITSPTNAFATFTSALTSIEASQTQYYTEKPEWCSNGDVTMWCDVVTSICGHGGGGRILFGYSNTIVTGNWDSRIDPIKTWGDSDYKYDFVGDNLIIDGEDKNVGFSYTGTTVCSQSENGQALRLHGVDNIVRNITWSGYNDGIHMRHGMRMLFEGIQTPHVCEDAVSTNGVGGACVDCTARNCTFGASTDKTYMNSSGDGWRHLGSSRLVISGMYSVGGNQPIRNGGERKSLTIVRNSTFLGDSQGPRFGGEKSTVVFENNYSSVTKRDVGGVRIGEAQSILLRGNTIENCTNAYGILTFTTGAVIRAENNIIRGNGNGVIVADGVNMDLGGGLADLWATNHPASDHGIGPGATAVPSIGRNTITGNTGYDLINNLPGTPQPEVKAEHNFWDHTSVSEVLSTDISGAADVDPLGVNID